MKNSISLTKAITLLIVSILIIFAGLLFVKAPAAIVLITAGIAAIILSLLWGFKWEDIENDIIDTLRKVLLPILIMFGVGMLIGAWMLAGTIPVIIYYGLLILKPSIFLVAAALACALMSLMTGTSWGTIGTIGVALMGVSIGFGIPPHYSAGAIVAGAYFGDKLSPLSDGTIMAAALTEVNIVEHIKHLMYTTIPCFVISLILYIILGFQLDEQVQNTKNIELIMSTLEANFNLSPILLLPPLIVLFLIFKQKPTLPVFGIGILLGCILAVFFQGRDLLEIANTLNNGFTDTTNVKIVNEMLQQGGLSSMYSTVAVIFAAALFGAPLRTSGVVQVILEKIVKVAKTGKTMMASCLSIHGLFYTITGSWYVSFSVFGPMLAPLYDKYGLHRKNLSRTLEDSGSAFGPAIPWSTTGVFIASTLNVPTGQFILYTPVVYLAVVFALIYIFTGFGIAKADPEVIKDNMKKEAVLHG
ncbi:Na+/H+ antiporter NhaC [Bacillus aerolatus]|uniref:Na+/H+ antiporter NhaC n=1 Tax=Bacillus aerolatus TaxID=2653354 RepID=A0A6I1FLD8_9BACI|nr:Na+/H+ antiporter NhaC [Bacillus aerolatus]KAB7707087.1 Na+/H+ antiporter NhaC [Bacillus aerolatus]